MQKLRQATLAAMKTPAIREKLSTVTTDRLRYYYAAAGGGRVMVARSLETIAISADLKARALPAFEAWIIARGIKRP